MKVHPKQLVPGCIVQKTILGMSGNPIVKAETVIENQHIEALVHFGIEQMDVKERMVTGLTFKPQPYKVKDKQSTKKTTVEEPEEFETIYVRTVEQYKKMFKSWQGGTPIDLGDVRKMVSPLFHSLTQYPPDLFILYKYATARDYIYHHAVSVSLLSAYLAKKMEHDIDWFQIGLAGVLADSGMSRLNPNWLIKGTELTIQEFKEMKKHPTYSYQLVENITALTKAAKLAILQHHERLDGSGYPLGVKADKIHPYAKIIAIVDTYHAMTSERAYKPKKSPFKVMEEMLSVKHQKYDYTTLNVFVEAFINYSIGSEVVLSNGDRAHVVYIHSDNPTRPMVRLDNNEIINLNEKKTLYIENILT
ncbi:HD-GYP domain-containing protein (c-di-GMP phosphodiesterase class II) [Gracilibacillus halotolerans]|uniref:HD-GYP domain-containing protein (C-di-GMP phosphodiesterase class II) n=1 Tax=Gracilibacillus halotolerans TaxID=74386 RepID=A0A841RLN4_9BACI|nr:HD-GYP domain-containing protein [Gracilibacillus halotolerans]MBB6513399.1 HD-GYP domain-containing protein (c-di-GMP phosphodiesterase class II) [Gracilibacillus halotolerans]